MAIINFNTSNNELNVVFNDDDYAYLASLIVKLTLFIVFIGVYKNFNRAHDSANYDTGSRVRSFVAHPESDVLSESDSEE